MQIRKTWHMLFSCSTTDQLDDMNKDDVRWMRLIVNAVYMAHHFTCYMLCFFLWERISWPYWHSKDSRWIGGCCGNCFSPNGEIHGYKYAHKLKVSMPQGSIKNHCLFQHLFSEFVQFYSNKLVVKYFLFPPFFHLTPCGVVHSSDLQRWGDNGEGQREKRLMNFLNRPIWKTMLATFYPSL